MRIAVISPFVDRRHGTERALAELLDRLALVYHCEIHLFSQRVEELTLDDPHVPRSSETGAVLWHKVPTIPGPHLLQFIAWLFLNRLCRWWVCLRKGFRFDFVFSPGINSLDAEFILVHAVFHRLRDLQVRATPQSLRNLHRALYYRFLCYLERYVYRREKVTLATVSQRTAGQLHQYFGRQNIPVIPNGVDISVFSPACRKNRRAAARQSLQFAAHEQVLLLIGNDWRNKGLPVLLEAAAQCRDLPLHLLIAGEEDASSFAASISHVQLTDRVSFSTPATAILDLYAAADIYVAPSLEDSFNLPALEAMACGLPVIVSTRTGISEYIQDGVNGVLLQNPEDPVELSRAIRKLLDTPELMYAFGESAIRTASALSWDSHAAAIYSLFCRTLKKVDSDCGNNKTSSPAAS